MSITHEHQTRTPARTPVAKYDVQILALKVYNFGTWVEKCRISLYAKKVNNNGKCNKNYNIIPFSLE